MTYQTNVVKSPEHFVAKAKPQKRRPKTKAQQERDAERHRRGWWNARIGALTKVFGGTLRYGGGGLYQFTDDDAGREDLHILLDHYAYSNPLATPRVIKARAPWLSEPERESLMDQVGRFPRYWTSPALAEALRLTEAERVALGGVPTIGAIDVTPEQRREKRKDRDKERKAAVRRAKGAKPREKYLADAKSQTKPWEADGISRSAWERRRRKANAASPSAVNLVNRADTLAALSETLAPVSVAGKVPSGPILDHDMPSVVSFHRRKSQISESCRAEPVSPNDSHQQEKKAA